MTLVIGMSKDEGIYLSVDYRITDARTGELLDDSSVKFLTVWYPPLEGGPKALLAYTGIAHAPSDGTPVGDWIRETLRGEAETFDASMRHLRRRLDRDFAPATRELIINALVVHRGRRYFGGLSNVGAGKCGRYVRDTFGYTMNELTEPLAFANGSGPNPFTASRYLNRLKSQLNVRPRRVLDHMNLLATMNRRIAAENDTVSPFCHVGFVNADERYKPVSRVFTKPGETVSFHMPILIYGIDVSVPFGHFNKNVEAVKAGGAFSEVDPEEFNRQLARRP